MLDESYQFAEALVFYHEDSFFRRVEQVFGRPDAFRWRKVNLPPNLRTIKQEVEQFYGKRNYLRALAIGLWQALWWFFYLLFFGAVKLPKLGDSGKIVLLHHSAFPDRDEMLNLVADLRKSLRRYYLLVVLISVEAVSERRQAYAAEVDIVLEPRFPPRDLYDAVLAARALEDRTLEHRASDLQREFWSRLLGTVGAMLIGIAIWLGKDRATNWCSNTDSRWSAVTYVGKPVAPAPNEADGHEWVECCIQVRNEGGSPKWGFELESSIPSPLKVQDLPPSVPDYIEAGRAAEVRFQLGVPRQLPADLRLDKIGVTVADRHGNGGHGPLLPEPVRALLQNRQGVQAPPPPPQVRR